MIIAVSDVHLAMGRGDRKLRLDDAQFLKFLGYIRDERLREGGHLVLLGDIIDFWRRDFTKALVETAEVFDTLNKFDEDVKIHYIVGNHDFYVLTLKDVLEDRFPFESVGRHEVIDDYGRGFFFTHGYQLEVLANPYYKSLSAYERFSKHLCLMGDDTGNAADVLWERYSSVRSWLDGLMVLPPDIEGALHSMMEPPDKRLNGKHKSMDTIRMLASSKSRRMYLGTGKDDVLVFGHTHRPIFDMSGGVINTGSWKKSGSDNYIFLEIDRGVPCLMEFTGRGARRISFKVPVA